MAALHASYYIEGSALFETVFMSKKLTAHVKAAG